MDNSTFWILLVVVCAGVRHLARTLPVPPDVGQVHLADDRKADRGYDRGDELGLAHRRYLAHDLSDDIFDSFIDTDEGIHPAVNIDGTPMMDDFVDMHGNAFGICDFD